MDLEQNNRSAGRSTETVAASQADRSATDVPPAFVQDLFGRVPAEDLAAVRGVEVEPGDSERALAEVRAAGGVMA